MRFLTKCLTLCCVMHGLKAAVEHRFVQGMRSTRERRAQGMKAWGYAEKEHGYGPSSWAWDCKKQKQSPINIDTRFVQYYAPLTSLSLTGYNMSSGDVVMVNNGHSVTVTLNPGMSLKAPAMKGTFVAKQFHFHWGRDNSVGSEHAINMRVYPLEMHIVHMNTKYPSIESALNYPDGISVLAFMFMEGEHNKAFDSIVQHLANVAFKGDTTTISDLTMSDIMVPASGLSRYYRYHGSLTTPPCSEVVIWHVFSDPIQMSTDQFDVFRKGINLDHHVRDNHRPLMPLGYRLVYTGNRLLISSKTNVDIGKAKGARKSGSSGEASTHQPTPTLTFLFVLHLPVLYW